jgi:hypothetical protein
MYLSKTDIKESKAKFLGGETGGKETTRET